MSVKKLSLTVAGIFVLTFSLVAVESIAITPNTRHALKPAHAKTAQDPAVSLVLQQFRKYGKRVSSLSMDCLSFEREPSAEPEEAQVTLREIHNEKCGGDPGVSPRVATFTVRGKKVMIEDIITGDLVPFDASYKGAE